MWNVDSYAHADPAIVRFKFNLTGCVPHIPSNRSKIWPNFKLLLPWLWLCPSWHNEPDSPFAGCPPRAVVLHNGGQTKIEECE